MNWSVRIPQPLYQELHAHLHQPDRDEHAAFLSAGEARVGSERRLLVRRVSLIPAEDFGPSNRGAYRQVASRAIAAAARECEARGERLLWAHSHPGADSTVSFSGDDLATHKRAHPHLIDMTGGRTVASLVMGTGSVAGEVWTSDGAVSAVDHVDVVGSCLERLTASPESVDAQVSRFDRQILMFGRHGQAALRRMTVAVIGAGGGGSLLVQSLAHLGVGRLIILDFDRVETTNLSRIVGATPRDARVAAAKIDVAKRYVNAIDPNIEVEARASDITYAEDARQLLEADFIFSATDTQFARFAFNAVCHQYLIPGAQVGAKVVADADGHLSLAYAMHRPIDLAGSCLECGGAINAEALRIEQLGKAELRGQQYVGAMHQDLEVPDPSVITLNSAAASMAMLDFQFTATGMHQPETRLSQRIYHAAERELRERDLPPRPGCRWCDRVAGGQAFGRGDDLPLPLKPGASQGLRPRPPRTPFWTRWRRAPGRVRSE